jgi:formylglycine-generating enzyme required for sulfatase activity
MALWPLSSLAQDKPDLSAFDVSSGNFVSVKAGSFFMGSEPGVGEDDERPRRHVTISQGFYLGKYELTQPLWELVMGENPSYSRDVTHPVETVSWNDTQAFIQKLNELKGTTGYRLPTEAEWEYAARAGTDTAFFYGDDPSELDQYAWTASRERLRTQSVGQKQPNPWGFYDIYGNVWEWVQDWYAKDYYGVSPATDPQGPDSGVNKSNRGCSWFNFAKYCRSANRSDNSPNYKHYYLGFRLAYSEPR